MRLIIFNPYSSNIINPRSIRIQNLCKEIEPFINYLHICNPIHNVSNSGKNQLKFHGFNLRVDNSSHLIKKTFIQKCINNMLWPDIFLMNSIYQAMVYFIKYMKKGDYILSVSNPISIHLPFYFLRKLGLLKKKWIVDIGDTFEIQSQNAISKSLNNLIEKSICNSADYIIVNSESMRNYYLVNYRINSSKLEVIENGTNLDFSKWQQKPSSNIRISYYGNTYLPLRDAKKEMDLLSRVAINLSYQNMLIEINLYGQQYMQLIHLFKDYSFIHFNNQLNETDKLSAYESTDILISFANKKYAGMPSKLAEYKATGLPIIYFCFDKEDPGALYIKEYPHVLIFSLVYDDLPILEKFIYSAKSTLKNNNKIDFQKKDHSWKILLDKLNNWNRL